ncbi:MAG: hypothetical protein Q9159_003920 [Coniocarpon cinnabarinum]
MSNRESTYQDTGFKESAEMKARREKAEAKGEGSNRAEAAKNYDSWGERAKEKGKDAFKHLNPLGGNPPEKGSGSGNGRVPMGGRKG